MPLPVSFDLHRGASPTYAGEPNGYLSSDEGDLSRSLSPAFSGTLGAPSGQHRAALVSVFILTTILSSYDLLSE